jgi:hypothetical protein
MIIVQLDLREICLEEMLAVYATRRSQHVLEFTGSGCQNGEFHDWSPWSAAERGQVSQGDSTLHVRDVNEDGNEGEPEKNGSLLHEEWSEGEKWQRMLRRGCKMSGGRG